MALTNSANLTNVWLRDQAPGRRLERVTGIEPASPAWKAGALPLSYTRQIRFLLTSTIALPKQLVEGVGFEPT